MDEIYLQVGQAIQFIEPLIHSPVILLIKYLKVYNSVRKVPPGEFPTGSGLGFGLGLGWGEFDREN